MVTARKIRKNAWQEALINLITDPHHLLRLLDLQASALDENMQAALQFPLKVTQSFVARMQKGNPNDPLLRQVLPGKEELILTPGYSEDPLGEGEANPMPGLLHKYAGRVLFTMTGACAIHCRYCFRRYFPYAENTPSRAGLDKLLEYVAADDSLCEVILSGGDPLMLNDSLLQQLLMRLANIKHITRLRIHTRLPIVLPERITSSFLNVMSNQPFKMIMVVHANHAQEINAEVQERLQVMKTTGMTLLNQSVLLHKVNDDAETLIRLSETLFAADVLPYYLHLLDKVQGTQHFAVSLQKARALHETMCASLPGYLVPKLVREIAHAKSKTLMS